MNWAFNWVQIMAHHKKLLGALLALLSAMCLSGLVFFESRLSWQAWGISASSLVVMSAALAWLLASVRTALVQLGLGLYILLMTLGGLGWLGVVLDANSVLGLVVVMTLMTSNLIHVLSSLLREMARGLFQFDAVAEALKLNHRPIFLSNLTTLLGFVFAAWYEPQLQSMAVVVTLGAILSYAVTLSWLPLILLSWLLEFRVGNPSDRHGYLFVLDWMKRYPRLSLALTLGMLTLLLGLVLSQPMIWNAMANMWGMLLVLALLFVVFWHSVHLALLNTLANFAALLFALALFVWLVAPSSLPLLWLMVPMGLIVDDGIHFFSRYVRAKQGLFRDNDSAVRYAMASVARPIWLSSWTLFLGVGVLLLSSNDDIQQASWVTLLSLATATAVILWLIPAYLVRRTNQ
ncbi:hypothetical protein QCB44_05220 [Thiomicrorhabdus sp. zzn3]|uniref:hypothetical protein n=1 Tax=Thiomicrorhabdus sp. zzn3 TaxID=3039775 RepID=UPI00243709B7|nr:hypothetical protein [Thiomicrorhabdus sp. zzn3]MDG6778100.1 hypothetical protein [Thiomicrorhabdus sp. zzn3]